MEPVSTQAEDEALKKQVEAQFIAKGVVVLNPANPDLTREQRDLIEKFTADERRAGAQKPPRVVVYDKTYESGGGVENASAQHLATGEDVILISSSELKMLREDKNATQPLADRQAWILEHEAAHIRNGDTGRIYFTPRYPGDVIGSDEQNSEIFARKRETEFKADEGASRESGNPRAGIEALEANRRSKADRIGMTPEEYDEHIKSANPSHPPAAERIERIKQIDAGDMPAQKLADGGHAGSPTRDTDGLVNGNWLRQMPSLADTFMASAAGPGPAGRVISATPAAPRQAATAVPQLDQNGPG